MQINTRIKAVEIDFQKWQLIVINKDWEMFGKTEIEAIALREYFEGVRDGLVEAKYFFNCPEFNIK